VKSHGESAAAPAADSATVALWHLDENGGQHVGDAGPFGLDGAAGLDTRTDFGRFRSARVFSQAKDSYVVVDYNPVMDVDGPMTIEAWVLVDAVTQFQLQVIASRWTPIPNQQSWVLGVTGYGTILGVGLQEDPNWFRTLIADTGPQRLLFGYVPAGAGAERGYASSTALPIGRWVHVAATVDGEVVRLYVDGRLDAQYVNTRVVRASPAPLVIGNALDPRHLTTFGGDLRIDPAAPVKLYYPFSGQVDEVRLSRGARQHFESTSLR
jgi:hypothetical protein